MEQTTPIAVITIPVQEWNETKELIKSLHQSVNQLRAHELNELLTPKEVCEMLKIGRTTFQRYIANGTLEPIRVNREKYGKIYVRRADIEGLLNEE